MTINTHSYQIGQEIKVAVERQTIYDNHGHVPANHVSVKTLLVLSVHSTPGTYVVKVKGPGTILRFSEAKDAGSFGSLSGKRVRYDVIKVLDQASPKLTDAQVEREVLSVLKAYGAGKWSRLHWSLPSEVLTAIWIDHPQTSSAKVRAAIKRLEEQGKVERHSSGRYVRCTVRK